MPAQTMERHNAFWDVGAETISVHSSVEDSGVKNMDRIVREDREASEIVVTLRDHVKGFRFYLKCNGTLLLESFKCLNMLQEDCSSRNFEGDERVELRLCEEAITLLQGRDDGVCWL